MAGRERVMPTKEIDMTMREIVMKVLQLGRMRTDGLKIAMSERVTMSCRPGAMLRANEGAWRRRKNEKEKPKNTKDDVSWS